MIDKCDSILDKDPDDVTALFFKGGSLGFRGRLRANRGSWIKAANDGRLALPIVRRAYSIAPDNDDILLGMGIYNYYAEAIPEQYPIVKPLMLFFPNGDKKKGIEQLTAAAAKAKYAAVEADYFLLQLNYTHERQYEKALEIALKLFNRYPKNVVFHRYVGRCYISLGKWENAHAVFREILSRCDGSGGGMEGYTDSSKREALYYLGVYAMNTGKYRSALPPPRSCGATMLLGLAGERLRAEVELAVELLHGGAAQRDLAPRLAVGAAELEVPGGGAAAVPVDGVDEGAAADGAVCARRCRRRGAAAGDAQTGGSGAVRGPRARTGRSRSSRLRLPAPARRSKTIISTGVPSGKTNSSIL